MIRKLIWAAAAAVVILVLGPMFLRLFRPPPDTYLDFVQEWLSARCYWMGHPVYLPQREAMRRVTSQDHPQLDERPWNAHPPVAVMVALPFGLIGDYRQAHLAWNILTFALFLLSLGLILRELRIKLYWWSTCPILVLLVADNPVISQLWHGQLNFLLAFVLTAAWAANRRNYRLGAGFLAGLAIAIKLFPGILLLYFFAARLWRQTFAATLTAVCACAVALGLFGWTAFDTYTREVLPSLEVFRGSWGNASITGYLTRISRAFGLDRTGPAIASIGQIGVMALIAFHARRATTCAQYDRAYMLAIAGMPLASPIAWAYYFVLLPLPLIFLWHGLPSNWTRGVLAVSVTILLLPEGLYPGIYHALVPGSPDVSGLANHLPTPPEPGLNVIGLGLPTLALLSIFMLLALSPLHGSSSSLIEEQRSAR
jgi:alpha-1,2-mannosyltransferase